MNDILDEKTAQGFNRWCKTKDVFKQSFSIQKHRESQWHVLCRDENINKTHAPNSLQMFDGSQNRQISGWCGSSHLGFLNVEPDRKIIRITKSNWRLPLQAPPKSTKKKDIGLEEKDYFIVRYCRKPDL